MYRTILASAAAVITVATSLTAVAAPAAATPPQPGTKAVKLSAPTNVLMAPSRADLTWQYPGENVSKFEIDPLGRTQPISVPVSALQKDGAVYEYNFPQPTRLPVRVRAITQDGTSSPWSRISRTGWGLDAVVTSSSSVADRTHVRVDTNAPRVEFKFAKPGSKDLTRTVLSRRGQAEVSVKGEWDTVTVRGMGLLKSRVGTASTTVLSRATMFDVAVNTLTGQRVDLAWVTPEGARSVTATRTPIDVAGKPTGLAQTVPATLTGLVDATVKAGQGYEYNVTVNFGGRTVATSSIQVQTPGSDGNSFVTQPEVVTAGETTVVTASEPVVVTGADGEPQASITVKLGGPQPELGQGVILPPTESTPQGFMGRVTRIDSQGVQVTSVPIEELFVELNVSGSAYDEVSILATESVQGPATGADSVQVSPANYIEPPTFMQRLVRSMLESTRGGSPVGAAVSAMHDAGTKAATPLAQPGDITFMPAIYEGETEPLVTNVAQETASGLQVVQNDLSVVRNTLIIPGIDTRSGSGSGLIIPGNPDGTSQTGSGITVVDPPEGHVQRDSGLYVPEKYADAAEWVEKKSAEVTKDRNFSCDTSVKLVFDKFAARASMVIKDGEKHYESASDVLLRLDSAAPGEPITLECAYDLQQSFTWMLGPVPFTVSVNPGVGVKVALPAEGVQDLPIAVQSVTDSRLPIEEWDVDVQIGQGEFAIPQGFSFGVFGYVSVWAGVGVVVNAGIVEVGAVAGLNVAVKIEVGFSKDDSVATSEGQECFSSYVRVTFTGGIGVAVVLDFDGSFMLKQVLAMWGVPDGDVVSLHAWADERELLNLKGKDAPWKVCWTGEKPVVTPEPVRIIDFTQGRSHACFLTSKYEVYCVGANEFGQLGNGSWDASPVTPVKVDITGVTDLIAARDTTIAQVNAGRSTWAWGRGDLGQLGNGEFKNSNVPVQVLASAKKVVKQPDDSVCFVTEEGILCPQDGGGSLQNMGRRVAWTFPTSSSDAPSGGGDSSSSVEVTCEANAVGELICEADNGIGQVDPESFDGATSPSSNHVCLVTEPSRELLCFGDNTMGQLGNGTVDPTALPTQVVNLGPVRKQTVTGNHTCATTTDGHTFCWGANEDGLLDLAGVGAYSHTPVYCEGGLFAPKCVGGTSPAPVSPTPQPTPGATTPAPQPTPSGEVTPQPVPSSEPTPQPTPQPTPNVTTPTPQPTPQPTPNVTTPAPQPTPQPTPTPTRERQAPGQARVLTSTVGFFGASFIVTATSPDGVDSWEYQLGQGGQWGPWTSSNSVTIPVSGLAEATEYQFRTRAINSAGAGTASDTLEFTTKQARPSTPVSLQSFAGNRTILVEFVQPNGGSSEVVEYQYATTTQPWLNNYDTWASFGPGESVSPVFITQDSSGSALVNGVAYGVKLRAVNSDGYVSAASAATLNTPLTTPSQTLITEVRELPVGGVHIAATVADNGGSAILGVEYSLNGDEWVRLPSQGGVTFTGLPAGSTNSVVLRHYNVAGAGPTSSPVVFTAAYTPGTPGLVSVDIPAGEGAVAHFSPAPVAGTPVLGYEYSLSGGPWSPGLVLEDAENGTLALPLPGVKVGRTDTVRIRATSKFGPGPESESSPFTPWSAPSTPHSIEILVEESGDTWLKFSVDDTNARPIKEVSFTVPEQTTWGENGWEMSSVVRTLDVNSPHVVQAGGEYRVYVGDSRYGVSHGLAYLVSSWWDKRVVSVSVSNGAASPTAEQAFASQEKVEYYNWYCDYSGEGCEVKAPTVMPLPQSARIDPRATQCVLYVSPGNPTEAALRCQYRTWLAALPHQGLSWSVDGGKTWRDTAYGEDRIDEYRVSGVLGEEFWTTFLPDLSLVKSDHTYPVLLRTFVDAEGVDTEGQIEVERLYGEPHSTQAQALP